MIVQACQRIYHVVSFLTRQTYPRGFTLIEMVVAVGLMGLLLGSSIVGYSRFNQRQIIVSAGKEYVAVLRLAQKRATVGDKPDVAGCNAGEKLDGYRVRAAINTSTYVMAPLCNGTEVAAAAQTYTFSPLVVFKQAVDVRFLVLSRGVVFGAGGTSVTTDVGSATSPGWKYTVQVTRSGEIHEEGISGI